MKSVCIAFLNSKGGVGKTTSAVNTAAALAEVGRRVLLIDMDAQSHVASHLGLDVDPACSIDAVLQDRHARIGMAIQPSPCADLDVVLSTGKLEEVEKLLFMRNQPLDALWKALQGLEGYEFVLIDCAPGLGILTLNAMRASDYLIIPTDLDKFSVEGAYNRDERNEVERRRLALDDDISNLWTAYQIEARGAVRRSHDRRGPNATRDGNHGGRAA